MTDDPEVNPVKNEVLDGYIPPIRKKKTFESEKEMTAKFMTPSFLKQFVEIYRNANCLWQSDSKDYHNRRKRDAALAELLQFSRQRIPGATADFLRRRLESIRTCFRREFRKIQASQAKGESGDDLYRPNLWYYDLFEFWETTVGTVRPSNKFYFYENDFTEGDTEDSQHWEEEGSNEYDLLDVICKEEIQETDITTPNSSTKRKLHETITSKKIRTEEESSEFSVNDAPSEEMINTATSTSTLALAREEDEYDVVGKLVAAKLRRMKDIQRIHAEKLINDVLYKGLLEKLDESTLV